MRTNKGPSDLAKMVREALALASAIVAEYRAGLPEGFDPQNATATTLFEIRRRHLGDPISVIFPSGYISPGTGAVIAPRGIALMGAGSVQGSGEVGDINGAQLASGQGAFLGFLTRDVVDGGPTLFEVDIPATYVLGLPFTAGLECAVEKAELVECEGAQYVCTSGTGYISPSAPIGTKLSFDGQGRFYCAQSGDNVYYALRGNSGLPGNQPVPLVSTNLRILAEMIAAG